MQRPFLFTLCLWALCACRTGGFDTGTAGEADREGHETFEAFLAGSDPSNRSTPGPCTSHDEKGDCEDRRRQCADGERQHYAHFGRLEVSSSIPGRPDGVYRTWVVYEPCAFLQDVAPDEALGRVGLERRALHGYSTTWRLLLYETNRPGVWVGLAPIDERPGQLRAAKLLTLPTAEQRAAAFERTWQPDLTFAKLLDFLRAPPELVPAQVCPLAGADRQAVVAAARQGLARATHDNRGAFFALAKLLSDCGEGDEAAAHLVKYFDEATGEDAALVAPLRARPEAQPTVARALLRLPSTTDVREGLLLLPRALGLARPGGGSLDEGALARLARLLRGWPEKLDDGEERNLSYRCPTHAFTEAEQQRARTLAERAIADGRLATAAFLDSCLVRFEPTMPLVPQPRTPDLTGVPPREAAVRIAGAVLSLLAFTTPIQGDDSTTWVTSDAFHFARWRLSDRVGATLGNPGPLQPLPPIIRVDASQLKDEGEQARDVLVGGDDGSSAREAAAQRQALEGLGARAKALLAERDALESRLAVLEQRIANPGVTVSGTRPGTVPLGTTTSTRFWTDKYGIQHRETTTGTQGGQTMGGPVVMQNLTVEAQDERRTKRAELEKVEQALGVLQREAGALAARKPAKAATPAKRISVSGYHAWRGTIRAAVGYWFEGREYLAEYAQELKSGERYTPLEQLLEARNEKIEELIEPAGVKVRDALFEKWVRAARGTSEQLERERAFLRWLVKDEPKDFDVHQVGLFSELTALGDAR